MTARTSLIFAFAVVSLALLLQPAPALANGGPFVVVYPNGDPAAKGILARLDPNLKPAREERLRVLKEDLTIRFGPDKRRGAADSVLPLANVEAVYTIENPTGEEIAIDFGFPILRGIYVNPWSMLPRPAVHVKLNDKHVDTTIISNSVIYGIIRQHARQAIDTAIANDATLASLVAAAKSADEGTRIALDAHLRQERKWTKSDAALFVEYAGLTMDKTTMIPFDRRLLFGWGALPAGDLSLANLGPLSAIGEQKATQFLAHLAARFDPSVTATYESIFSAWGGDVRERSVDLRTGAIRPREIQMEPAAADGTRDRAFILAGDPTVYARVDYLDEKAPITDTEKQACRRILKNLPVIFTFAPMNLLHYHATFPPHKVQTVTVSYEQYAYTDTAKPKSHQLAYVVHPASLWKEFGPIHLKVEVPAEVPFRASVPCGRSEPVLRKLSFGSAFPNEPANVSYVTYEATLTDKTGELFLGLDAHAWQQTMHDWGFRPAPRQ